MSKQVDQEHLDKGREAIPAVSKKKGGSKAIAQFEDNRPETTVQGTLQELADNSPRIAQLRATQDLADKSTKVSQLRALQKLADNSLQTKEAAQLQAITDDSSANHLKPSQKNANNTGLPDNLKSGIENLSGYSMDDVKVHYNSDKPAQLHAHAYAQGTDIHLGSGQEKHLPHEAWHVVQQKQGRVKPTIQMKALSQNKKESTRNEVGSTNEHYYFNPENSKTAYSSHTNGYHPPANPASTGPTVQLVAIKGWGFYTSSEDTAVPKQQFKDAAAVLAWEATLPAAPAAVPAGAPVAAAPVAVAPVVAPAAPAAAPITVGGGMTNHFNDHKDKYLPKTNAQLIDYVEAEYDNFVQSADGTNWTLDLDDYLTRRKGGNWEFRNWKIMIWDDTNEIHHFGPMG